MREPVELGVMGLRAGRRGRLLDIGCGNGAFLARMRELGWEVAGIERDGRAAEAASGKWNIPVQVARIDNATVESGSFDVITMNHVLEHLSDPLRNTERMRTWLKSGGEVILTAPNVSALCHRIWRGAWQHLDPPRHLFLFSKKALCAVLQRAGFSAIRVETSSRSAAETWKISCAVRRQGKAPSGKARCAWTVRAGGALVQVWEASWPRRGSFGEELVAVARYGGREEGWTAVGS